MAYTVCSQRNSLKYNVLNRGSQEANFDTVIIKMIENTTLKTKWQISINTEVEKSTRPLSRTLTHWFYCLYENLLHIYSGMLFHVVWTVWMRLIVSDAVEGQSSCTVIHKHSYSPADGLYRENSPYVIVSEWVTGGRAEQALGLIIRSKPKPKPITQCLPADALIWHWYTNTIISTPAPSNSVHTHSLYTSPDATHQI